MSPLDSIAMIFGYLTLGGLGALFAICFVAGLLYRPRVPAREPAPKLEPVELPPNVIRLADRRARERSAS